MTMGFDRSGKMLQLATFQLGDESYGIEVAKVQEIVWMTEITHVPRSADFVEGVVNLRGKIIPVLDLRRRFGLAAQEVTPKTRIVVVKVGPRVLGLIVDRVHEVVRMSADTVTPPPEMVTQGMDNSYLKGVAQLGDRLIILLDLELLLSADEVAQLAV